MAGTGRLTTEDCRRISDADHQVNLPADGPPSEGSFARLVRTLDNSGRLTLGHQYRTQYPAGGYVTTGIRGSLILYNPMEYEDILNRILAAMVTRADRNFARFWSSTAQELTLDKRGRLRIPHHLKAHMGESSEVIVHVVPGGIQLWSAANLAAAAPTIAKFGDRLLVPYSNVVKMVGNHYSAIGSDSVELLACSSKVAKLLDREVIDAATLRTLGSPD